jgi:Glycine cleavage system P-protein
LFACQTPRTANMPGLKARRALSVNLVADPLFPHRSLSVKMSDHKTPAEESGSPFAMRWRRRRNRPETLQAHGPLGDDTLAVFTEFVSLGLVKPPEAMGADIAVGECQSAASMLGSSPPRPNICARCRGASAAKRCMHRDGAALTLATREQHIRRDKATSNICTFPFLQPCVLGVKILRPWKHLHKDLLISLLLRTPKPVIDPESSFRSARSP